MKYFAFFLIFFYWSEVCSGTHTNTRKTGNMFFIPKKKIKTKSSEQIALLLLQSTFVVNKQSIFFSMHKIYSHAYSPKEICQSLTQFLHIAWSLCLFHGQISEKQTIITLAKLDEIFRMFLNLENSDLIVPTEEII